MQTDIGASMLEAYVLAKRAGLQVGIWHEPACSHHRPDRVVEEQLPEVPDGTRLVIAPDIRALTAPMWMALQHWVEAGGTLYCSYHRDMWIQNFEQLFGVR